jgi:hypothetical protein
MKYETTYIYYLHKGDNIPFYVGKSINVKLHRSYQHKKRFGKDTIIEILDEVDTKNWKFWECYWIEQFKQWGFNLLNKNNGGNGCTTLPEKSRHIKSKKMKKNWDNGNFKRKWEKPVMDNETGICYPNIKRLLIDINKENQMKFFYKNVGDNKKFSYIKK